MLKSEFEAISDSSVSNALYEKIETVYMECAMFSNVNGKEEIAEYYKKYGVPGIEALYKGIKTETEKISSYKVYLTKSGAIAERIASSYKTGDEIKSVSYGNACACKEVPKVYQDKGYFATVIEFKPTGVNSIYYKLIFS